MRAIFHHPPENNSSLPRERGGVLMSDIQMCWFVQLVAVTARPLAKPATLLLASISLAESKTQEENIDDI